MKESDSTVDGIATCGGVRLTRFASNGFIVLLLLLCVSGLIGALGGRTATANSADDGYRLSLYYPLTTRPGLDALWELKVVHPGGFRGPITVGVTADYFHLFEAQGFYPTPAATTRDDTYLYMRVDTPSRGDVFILTFDAYLQPYIAPSDLLENHAAVTLIVHGKRIANIPYTTWVFP